MLRVAVVQSPGVRLEQHRQTLAELLDLTRRAAGLGAKLVVLPECAFPAYWIRSRQEYVAALDAGMASATQFLEHMSACAREQRIHVCTGYIDFDGLRLRNAAALIDDSGRIVGRYSKCFLWDFDNDWFEPGESIDAFETALGRIGIMICADARLPEIPATLAARGAQLIVQPTAWVNGGQPDRLWNPQPEFLIPARARELGIPVASASKWGAEGGTTFVGMSRICDATGRVLATCASSRTEVVVADVELPPAGVCRMRDAERAVLLSAAPPTLPSASAPALPVAVAPAGAPLPAALLYEGASTSAAVAALLLQPTDVGWSASFLDGDRAHLLAVRAAGVEPASFGDVAIGVLDAAAAARFAPARVLALRGANVLLVYGESDNTLLRARAAENRVFVVGAWPDSLIALGPRGNVLAERPIAECRWREPEIVIRLPLAEAADKAFARGTDAFGGRTPHLYQFQSTPPTRDAPTAPAPADPQP